MIELTRFQKNWVAENQKITLKRASITVVQFLCVIFATTVLLLHVYNETTPTWATNVALFTVYAYVGVQWFGVLAGMACIVGLNLMDFFVNRQINKGIEKFLNDEADAAQGIGELAKQRRELQVSVFSSLISSWTFPYFRKPFSKTNSLVIIWADRFIDVALFATLIVSGNPFLAILHGVAALSNGCIIYNLSNRAVKFVKNLTPSEDERVENIDNLADRLFYETDQIDEA